MEDKECSIGQKTTLFAENKEGEISMVTVYSKEHLKKYKVVEKRYVENKVKDAKKTRDKEARELRKNGFKVETNRYNVFGDYVYTIDAKKLRKKAKK